MNTRIVRLSDRNILWLIIVLILALAALILWRSTIKQCLICAANDGDGDTPIVHLIDRSPCDSVTRPAPKVIVALTGGDSFEHEVHDCQRLVVRVSSAGAGSGSPGFDFGPLVGVFPLDSAMNLQSASDFAVGIPVATIYNWGGFGYANDPRPYAPLGIPDGWSCLWLRHSSRSSGFDQEGWIAAIVPVDSLGCAQATDSTAIAWSLTGGHLSVRLTPADSTWVSATPERGIPLPPEPTRDPFPRTARWGWDDQSGQHYLGVRCGRAWCVLGAPGFAPRRSVATGQYWRDIPGWFDEEHLAVEGNGRVVPGPWATIFPTDSLFELRNESEAEVEARFTRNTGMEVAVLEVATDDAGISLAPSALQAGVQTYQEKLNLDDAGISHIWLRLDPSTLEPIAEYRSGGNAPRSATSTKADTEAERHPHTQHGVMGAVRWRWLDTDQKQWEPCGTNACCDTGA